MHSHVVCPPSKSIPNTPYARHSPSRFVLISERPKGICCLDYGFSKMLRILCERGPSVLDGVPVKFCCGYGEFKCDNCHYHLSWDNRTTTVECREVPHLHNSNSTICNRRPVDRTNEDSAGNERAASVNHSVNQVHDVHHRTW